MKTLFFEILNFEIPPDDRDKIKSYWNEFRVEPMLIMSDKLIPDDCPVARVAGWYPLYIFYFREYLKNAPEIVKKTIIKHELGHCYLESDKTKNDYADKSFQESMNLIGTTKREAQARRINWSSEPVEFMTGLVNARWGGDEPTARSWLASNMPGGKV